MSNIYHICLSFVNEIQAGKYLNVGVNEKLRMADCAQHFRPYLASVNRLVWAKFRYAFAAIFIAFRFEEAFRLLLVLREGMEIPRGRFRSTIYPTPPSSYPEGEVFGALHQYGRLFALILI